MIGWCLELFSTVLPVGICCNWTEIASSLRTMKNKTKKKNFGQVQRKNARHSEAETRRERKKPVEKKNRSLKSKCTVATASTFSSFLFSVFFFAFDASLLWSVFIISVFSAFWRTTCIDKKVAIRTKDRQKHSEQFVWCNQRMACRLNSSSSSKNTAKQHKKASRKENYNRCNVIDATLYGINHCEKRKRNRIDDQSSMPFRNANDDGHVSFYADGFFLRWWSTRLLPSIHWLLQYTVHDKNPMILIKVCDLNVADAFVCVYGAM